MTRNVGSADRLARFLAAAALLICTVMAPFPLVARLLGLGLPGLSLLASVVFGSCLGYQLLGRSTCPVSRGS